MIEFILLVNKQGQTRLSQYYNSYTISERVLLEGELVRKWLSRNQNQCSFLDHQQFKVIYRRYASLYFIVGINSEDDVNELSMLEFIHNTVETLDRYFENVCELDIMFNIEKAHFIIDEMIMNGCILETNKESILTPLKAIMKASK